MAPPLRLQPQIQRIRSAGNMISQNSLKVKPSFKSLTKPLMRAFRASHTEGVEFPRGQHTIVSWTNALIEHYCSLDETRSDHYRERLVTLNVKEVNWFKETFGDEHEYIIATIYDPDDGVDRYVRIDRDRPRPFIIDNSVHPAKPYTIRKPLPSLPPTALSSSASSSSSSLSSRSSSSSIVSSASSISSYNSSPPTSAASSFIEPPPISCDPDGVVDTMWLVAELPDVDRDKKVRLMERTTFREWRNDSPAPTLLDLALIAKATHDNNQHQLWPGQCLWFSTMMMRVMQQADFRHVIAHRDSSITFQNYMSEIMEGEMVSFKARSMYKEQQSIIVDILQSYQTARLDVLDKVDAAAARVEKMKQQQEFIDEAVAQRDQAAAIAAEASAGAVEATARAAEAEARAAEAEARADFEARLRAKAEAKAERQAQKQAAAEMELLALRRQMALLEERLRDRYSIQDY